MAVDKLVDSSQLNSNLTSVANAIRAKGGTSASLTFPAGFVSAIGDIPSGGGGGMSGVVTFDFTKGLTDEETGTFRFVLFNGATQDSTGLHISGATRYASLTNINLFDHVVEIEVGDLSFQNGGNHGRFIMGTTESGLIYRNTGKWEVYGTSWAGTDPAISQSDYFANSTIRIEYPSSGNNVDIYKDGTQIFSSVKFVGSDLEKQILLGSNSASFYNATFKKCTIYTNEAYALKVLLGE